MKLAASNTKVTPLIARLPALTFLTLFLLTGLLAATSANPVIAAIHPWIAWLTVLAALATYVALAITPRLPAAILLPAILFTLWTTVCGAFPLLANDPDAAVIPLALTQVALAAILITITLLRSKAPTRPHFRWFRFALFLVAALVTLPVVATVASVNLLATGITARTEGFATLRPDGLYLEERRYERGDQEVRLIAMIHIAQNKFFDTIADSVSGSGPAIVLLEGVTDNEGLLKEGFSYEGLAELVGAISQETTALSAGHPDDDGDPDANPTDPHPDEVHYQRADVDIATFRPETIAILNTMGAFLADPTNPASFARLRAKDSPFRNPGADVRLMEDIVDGRNVHLTEEIKKSLTRYDSVVVPWGAMHLPAIQASLLAMGFSETGRVDRPAFLFWQ